MGGPERKRQNPEGNSRRLPRGGSVGRGPGGQGVSWPTGVTEAMEF
jgi:hypothetical protein